MKESDYPALEELCTRLWRNSLEFIYGRGESGELLWGELPRDSPLLLLGVPGRGKTCLAAAILQQLCVSNGAAHLHLVFLDRDRQIAPLFSSYPHTRAVATRPDQVGGALSLPLRERRRTHSPFWLVVVDGWDWLEHDGETYAGEAARRQFHELASRFASEDAGVRGGALIIAYEDTVPCQTRAVFALDPHSDTDSRWRERAGVPTWGYQGGRFHVERTRGVGGSEVSEPLLAPWLPATSPDFLASGRRLPAPRRRRGKVVKEGEVRWTP